ncbi:DUF2934 domain-containing protein [Pseudocolwellia sp. HL-MZ7]|uniref:DUF2934 domain-containing protein n=1 Tax=Pseudocolwellia sp. HL-MZ7 TaxID=3400627 RepID=UPI003CF0345D
MSEANSKKATSANKLNEQDINFNRHEKINVEAYELANARDFTNGNEIEDWLEAEKIVDTQLLK